MPDQVVPPIESPCSAGERTGPAGAPVPAPRMSAAMQRSARPRKPQDTSSRFAVPSGAASRAVSVGPARAPQLPPAERKPNRRTDCSGRNKSAMRLQKSDTANRLKTLTQTKKARATAGGATRWKRRKKVTLFLASVLLLGGCTERRMADVGLEGGQERSCRPGNTPEEQPTGNKETAMSTRKVLTLVSMVTMLFSTAAFSADTASDSMDNSFQVLGESLDSGLGDLSPSYTAAEFQRGYRVVGERLDSGLGDTSPC